MSPEQSEREGQSEDVRSALRHVLPQGVSASMRLASGRTVYVTVTDLSRTGACVVRRGVLDVDVSEEVWLDVSDFEEKQSVTLPARVQWVSSKGYGIHLGLLFRDGPLLPGTLLDQYLDQTLQTPRG
nr:PilZ domain-containing protein [Cyanobium gracile]